MKWKTTKKKTKDLIPADYNPRSLTEKERKDLEKSIKKFGAVEPVVINKDGTIIGGHQRVKIYADLGIDEIDVVVPEKQLTKKQEKELNLRLNRNTGHWDYDVLFNEFEVGELLEVGFDEDELSDIFDNVETFDSPVTEKDIKKAEKEIRVKTGELYQIGNSFLIVGDATNENDVDTLMQGHKADLIYCDPPYNIGYGYDNPKSFGKQKQKTYNGKYSDNKKLDEYLQMLDASIKNALKNSKDDVHVIYWNDQNHIGYIQDLFRQNGIRPQTVAMWIKNNFHHMPQKAFNNTYEPAIYGAKGKPKLNKNFNKETGILNKDTQTGNQLIDDIMFIIDLWLEPRDTSYEHPTQKPITLHEKPIKRLTHPGDIIVDLFGGSGSTLLAAELLGRQAFIMEMDEVFATVILNRAEGLLGIKAKKI